MLYLRAGCLVVLDEEGRLVSRHVPLLHIAKLKQKWLRGIGESFYFGTTLMYASKYKIRCLTQTQTHNLTCVIPVYWMLIV